MERSIQRVLVACRGESGAAVGRRVESADLEAVALYADVDALDTWLDEVAYATRIATDDGDPYFDGLKIVSAALDSGCDAVHPGSSRVARSAEHAHMVMNVGLAWIGSPPAALQACADRLGVRRVAHNIGLPVLGSSPPVERSDIPAAIARFGGGVRVASTVRGRPAWRSDGTEPLDAALERLGPGPFVVERLLPHARHLVVGVLGDSGGNVLLLGDHERSIARDGRVRVRESPAPGLDDATRARLAEALPKLVAALGVVGIGAVEILTGADGRWWVHDVIPALFDGFPLHEEIYGLDIVQAQTRLASGETLGWEQSEIRAAGCGVELTVCATGPGELDGLTLPEGASTVRAEGVAVDPAHDPVLARLVVSGPMRHALLVRARAELARIVVSGVSHDTAELAELLADPRVWEGRVETGMFDERPVS